MRILALVGSTRREEGGEVLENETGVTIDIPTMGEKGYTSIGYP